MRRRSPCRCLCRGRADSVRTLPPTIPVMPSPCVRLSRKQCNRAQHRRGTTPQARSPLGPRQRPAGARNRRSTARRIAERRPQQVDDLPLDLLREPGRNAFELRHPKGPQPSGHSGRQRRGAREEPDIAHHEAMRFEASAILVGCRVLPGRGERDGVPSKHGAYRDRNRRNVGVAAELGDEAAAGPQGPRDAGKHGIGLRNPVQDGVREHRVELPAKRQAPRIHEMGVDAARRRGLHHVGRRVHAGDQGAARQSVPSARRPRIRGRVCAPRLWDPGAPGWKRPAPERSRVTLVIGRATNPVSCGILPSRAARIDGFLQNDCRSDSLDLLASYRVTACRRSSLHAGRRAAPRRAASAHQAHSAARTRARHPALYALPAAP